MLFVLYLQKKKLQTLRLMTAKVASVIAMIFFTFNSSSRSFNIWYSYVHYFIFILHGFITNQLNDQLLVGLLARLVRALNRGIAEVKGSNPVQAWIIFIFIF